jgi:hypothetical protein
VDLQAAARQPGQERGQEVVRVEGQPPEAVALVLAAVAAEVAAVEQAAEAAVRARANLQTVAVTLFRSFSSCSRST